MDDQRVDRKSGGMRFRKLRIAWSVGCAIACVLLLVLWVRSYWWEDQALVPRPGGTVIVLGSGHGQLALGRVANNFLTEWILLQEKAGYYNQTYLSGSSGYWQVPHWIPMLCTAVSSVLPWIRQLKWRFSLRTLLIATTLVAVVLGLIVYAARK
jgi:hypothetical protein